MKICVFHVVTGLWWWSWQTYLWLRLLDVLLCLFSQSIQDLKESGNGIVKWGFVILTDLRPCWPPMSPLGGVRGREVDIQIYQRQDLERPDIKNTARLRREVDLASSLTDLAARSPASTAPSMYPLQCVAVSVPAKWTLSTGSRIILQGNREITELPEKALRINEPISALLYPREDRVTQIVSKRPTWLSQRWKALPYSQGLHPRAQTFKPERIRLSDHQSLQVISTFS